MLKLSKLFFFWSKIFFWSETFDQSLTHASKNTRSLRIMLILLGLKFKNYLMSTKYSMHISESCILLSIFTSIHSCLENEKGAFEFMANLCLKSFQISTGLSFQNRTEFRHKSAKNALFTCFYNFDLSKIGSQKEIKSDNKRSFQDQKKRKRGWK